MRVTTASADTEGRERKERQSCVPIDGRNPLGPRWQVVQHGARYRTRVQNLRIGEVVIAPRSPWQNPFVERVVGSIRRDCLDHVIVLSARHLRRILRAYLAYYHSSRTHLSLNKDPPDTRRMNCGSEIVYRYPPDLIYRRDKATN